MVPTLGCTLGSPGDLWKVMMLSCTSEMVIQVVWGLVRAEKFKIFKEILKWYY